MVIGALQSKKQPARPKDALLDLKNVGPAVQENFRVLGIETVEQLVKQDADDLYAKLSMTLGRRVDPCVHDIFSATIHQARTGEALPWWDFSDARKQRQKVGDLTQPSIQPSA